MNKIETVLKKYGFYFSEKTNVCKVYKNTLVNRSVCIFFDNKNSFTGNISFCDDKHTLDWVASNCKNIDTARYAVIGYFCSGDSYNAT